MSHIFVQVTHSKQQMSITRRF